MSDNPMKRLMEVSVKVATLIGPKHPAVVFELGECIEALAERVASLEKALRQISVQFKWADLDEFDQENADVEGAYDSMIDCARAALGEAE